MSERTPTLGEVLRRALDARDARLRVSLPGRIERYDATRRMADVKPLVMGSYVDAAGVRHAEPLPVLTNVPVLFPGGGGFFVTFPVAVGDVCELRFADASLDRWKAMGGEVDPVEDRPHDLSNAVALVGLESPAQATAAHATHAVLGMPDGARVELTPGGDVLLTAGGAVDFVALAAKVEAEIAALRNTVNSLVTAHNNHVHITTATIGASTVPGVISPTASPADPPASVGSVAASKVRAE